MAWLPPKWFMVRLHVNPRSSWHESRMYRSLWKSWPLAALGTWLRLDCPQTHPDPLFCHTAHIRPPRTFGDAAFGPAAIRGAGDGMAGGTALARSSGHVCPDTVVIRRSVAECTVVILCVNEILCPTAAPRLLPYCAVAQWALFDRVTMFLCPGVELGLPCITERTELVSIILTFLSFRLALTPPQQTSRLPMASGAVFIWVHKH